MHHVCHAVDRMGDKRVMSKCATTVRLCAACAVHVRHPTISSQRARASTAGQTPSFSFCQVDMYGNTRSGHTNNVVYNVTFSVMLTLVSQDCHPRNTLRQQQKRKLLAY